MFFIEIRAEKRKRKSEEKPVEEKTQSKSVNVLSVTMEMWFIIVCSFTVENMPRSTSPSKPTAPTTIADSSSCLDTKDPPQPTRKKIVLVCKKPQISTTSSSDQKPLTAVASSNVSSSGVNRVAPVSDGEEQDKDEWRN